MKRLAAMSLLLLMSAPLLAGVRKDTYPIPCSALWPAVKGTVRNSGDYAVIFLDHDELIATFSIGMGQGLRLGSAVLNPKGDTCEMQVQVPGFANLADDTGSFKKRVDKTLADMQAAKKP
jgi:hypothetical protein